MRERFFKLRDKLLNTTPKICIERAKIVTEAYKKYDAYPNIEKRAMALADVLRNMTIYIEEEQLLAGNQASSNRAAPLFPEYAFAYILDELDDLEKRSSDKFTITEENKKVLREILPWWEGKTLKDRAIAMQPQEVLDDRVTGVLGWQGNVSTGEGHIVPDYDMVVRLGFAGLRDKIQKHIDELDLSKPQDLEKLTFYRACKAIIDGCLDYIKRYCILAEEQAEQCKDAARKEELLGISERCQALLERAPETFFEALQCVWFVQVILHIETNGHSLSFGRFVGYGLMAKQNVYDDFIDGAKDGFHTVIQIMPTLIGLMIGVGILRASGFLDFISKLIAPLTELVGFPSELVPVTVVKMFSSSAATGLVLDIFKEYGTDSLIGTMTSLMMSSTETIFYTMSVYFMAVKVSKSRWTLAGALLATLGGTVASVVLAYMMV